MKVYLLRDGRLNLASELACGRPVVWSREEWLARYRSMIRRMVRDAFVFSGVIAYALVGTFAVAEYLATGGLRETAPFAVVTTGVLVALVIGTAAIVLVLERMESKGPMQELTTSGVQLYANLFVPYEEISEAIARRKDVRIVPRRAPESVPWDIPNPGHWQMDLGLLGEQGLHELMVRVPRHEPASERPKLVLYGPEGQR